MLLRIAWLTLALVHVLPAAALFWPALVERLYKVPAGDPAFVLLHHRAALFLVVVLLCLWAAFDPTVRRVAAAGTAISMISFLVLYWMNGFPPSLRGIAVADLAALPALAYVALKAFSR